MNHRNKLPAVITVGTSKGGVAKTTTAVNLSAALGERGWRALLVDADHHARGRCTCELDGDRSGAGSDIEHAARAAWNARDEERAPARILSEGQQSRVAVVRRAERREQFPRVARPRRDLGHASEHTLGGWR